MSDNDSLATIIIIIVVLLLLWWLFPLNNGQPNPDPLYFITDKITIQPIQFNRGTNVSTIMLKITNNEPFNVSNVYMKIADNESIFTEASIMYAELGRVFNASSYDWWFLASNCLNVYSTEKTFFGTYDYVLPPNGGQGVMLPEGFTYKPVLKANSFSYITFGGCNTKTPENMPRQQIWRRLIVSPTAPLGFHSVFVYLSYENNATRIVQATLWNVTING